MFEKLRFSFLGYIFSTRYKILIFIHCVVVVIIIITIYLMDIVVLHSFFVFPFPSAIYSTAICLRVKYVSGLKYKRNINNYIPGVLKKTPSEWTRTINSVFIGSKLIETKEGKSAVLFRLFLPRRIQTFVNELSFSIFRFIYISHRYPRTKSRTWTAWASGTEWSNFSSNYRRMTTRYVRKKFLLKNNGNFFLPNSLSG